MLIASSSVKGQGKYLLAEQVVGRDTAVFRFAPGDKVFRATYKGNEKAIAHLSRSIRAYYDEIQSGEVKIRVKGFWDTGASQSANLLSAKEHSNYIKSYFIVTDSVKEAHFRTTNYVRKWRGQPDVVAIAYLFRESGERVVTPPGAGTYRRTYSGTRDRTGGNASARTGVVISHSSRARTCAVGR